MPTQQHANDGGKDGQHRLTDIRVEEVSYVDRGANKKRFLVVKKHGGQMATKGELVPDGRGGLRRKTSKRDGDDEEETDKGKDGKKPPPFGGNKAPHFQPKKPKDGDEEEEETDKADDEEDDEETEKLDEEDEEETDKGGKGKGKKGDAEKGVVRKNMLASITEAIELLMDCAEELKEGDEEDEPPESVRANAKKAVGVLGKMLGAETVKSVLEKALGLTAKAGRKMSKERLDRFQKIVTDIQGLLKELVSSPELKDDAEKRGGFLRKGLAKIAKALGGVATGEDARVEQLVDALKEVTEHARDLEAKNKKLEKRIELLRKGEGTSNSLRVESREDGGGDGGDGVNWPLDLNAPIDREHTEKGMSFFEDEEN